MSRPSRTQSVFAQLAVFQTDDAQVNMNRAVEAAGFIDTSKTAAARYRDAVLSHTDLSGRLRAAFGYRDASQWNGYVPSFRDPDDKVSSSPHRALLVELVIEALKRNEDWQHGDNERLAVQPEHLIRAPWRDPRGYQSESARSARIAQILAGTEDD